MKRCQISILSPFQALRGPSALFGVASPDVASWPVTRHASAGLRHLSKTSAASIMGIMLRNIIPETGPLAPSRGSN